MSLTLSDGLAHYRFMSDTTHKFWGYFQAVAAGTAAFAWSREQADQGQFFLLVIAFSVFAILNWRLVVGSQAEMVNAAMCVKKYAESVQVPEELKPMLERLNPDPVHQVGLWHAGLSLATLAAVLWRHLLVT